MTNNPLLYDKAHNNWYYLTL